MVWSGLLRVLQRIVHYKHGDRLEFKLSFSVRDLLSDKSRAIKDQFEALVHAVQRAGSYQAREEAARAVHAVMDAMRERVPPDVLKRVADSLQLREAARLGRAAAQRLQKDGGKGESLNAAESATGAARENASAATEAESATLDEASGSAL